MHHDEAAPDFKKTKNKTAWVAEPPPTDTFVSITLLDYDHFMTKKLEQEDFVAPQAKIKTSCRADANVLKQVKKDGIIEFEREGSTSVMECPNRSRSWISSRFRMARWRACRAKLVLLRYPLSGLPMVHRRPSESFGQCHRAEGSFWSGDVDERWREEDSVRGRD